MKRAGFVLIWVAFAGAAADAQSLGSVRRVYVESLGSSVQAILMRDMIVSSLASCGLISITENADHADAILRGSADDLIYSEQHSLDDSLSAGVHSGTSEQQSDRYSHTGSSKQSALNIGDHESMHSTERKHEASAAVRLVNRDGDVIWSTTQESGGAKFKSASADVADRIFHKFAEDVQRARSLASASTQAGTPAR